ncbi:PLP-dependent aminotransferase family protein [Pseudooceanicola nanhaiensis]|uniref:MocR-like pyridoxine biosynthesis transcription factor PdxR n=1 Tax=Pseudooceanicola nanhaiensis TaxID=375761 RepID=UPI001CD5CDF4|nr:PLP-dependent aminotransferase family protein [Pseudooceanicola nanhaiensis]MCA0918828.1 PLP-dependent aminotransferase family protein [Pseudooceanicola nanhaiensis]
MSTSAISHQSNLDAALFRLTLDREGAQPLQQQLAEALRSLIRTGRHAGARLPSSRTLAAELSVSRMTVTTAYDQLTAEGYLVARRGAGTFVAADLPHLAPPAPRRAPALTAPAPYLPFQPGVPDQRLFPHRLWARHLERAWRSPPAALLARADPFGWGPLRVAISEHLAAWRGLEAAPDQIVITGGAWDAFDLISQQVALRGGGIAVEDPGWPTLHRLLARRGVAPHPVRIDAHGFDPSACLPGTAAAVVTPSRHYPTGRSMPLARRLQVLHWAEETGALVIEDDYDSEFRYQGQPLPSLAGLDGLRRTIYMGSFSKLLSPALRIGYLVLPEALVGAMRDDLAVTGVRASLLPQPALAGFMASGEFATHLRRMRRVYARRQAHLLGALEAEGVGRFLALQADPSGMHLVLPLLDGQEDAALAARASERGIAPRALSSHALLPDGPQGLLLGYAAYEEETLSAAAATLGEVLAVR